MNGDLRQKLEAFAEQVRDLGPNVHASISLGVLPLGEVGALAQELDAKWHRSVHRYRQGDAYVIDGIEAKFGPVIVRAQAPDRPASAEETSALERAESPFRSTTIEEAAHV